MIDEDEDYYEDTDLHPKECSRTREMERREALPILTGQSSANSSFYEDEGYFDNIARQYRPYTPQVPALWTARDPGIIYLFAHETDRMVKVGLTRRNAQARMESYIREQKLAGNWEMKKTWKVDDVRSVEQEIHKHLNNFKFSDKAREVFCCSVEEAVLIADGVIKRS